MENRALSEYENKMRRLHYTNDIENAHVKADEILCEILEKLGYSDIVRLYKEVPKYYS